MTDHKPLIWLCSIKNPSSRLIRWRIRLDEYDFEIKHKPGAQNTNADALSRIIIDGNDQKLSNILAITRAQAKNRLQDPDEISSSTPNINNNATNNNLLDLSTPHITTNSHDNSNSVLHSNDILHPSISQNISKSQTILNNSINSTIPLISDNSSISSDGEDPEINNSFMRKLRPKIINDYAEIQEVIEQFHKGSLGGHQGVLRTYKRMRYYVKFPNMLNTIKKFIKNCDLCQRNKSRRKTKLPMCLTTTSSKPFEKIFLDIFSLTSPSYSGNKCVLTIQDDLSKFSHAVPLPNQEASTVARALVENYICIFGAPRCILTDRGSNFMSHVFKQVCKLLKISKLETSAYHPQTNGALEKSHNTLVEYLRSCCDKDFSNWDIYLPYAMFIYNTTPHHSTKFMPYELIFGIIPNIPSSIKQSVDPLYNYDDYSKELKFRLQTVYEIAKNNLISSKNTSKRYYDRKTNCQEFVVGELVLVNNEARKDKLSSLRSGPYKILKLISPENVEIQMGRKTKIIHKNRLVRYFREPD